MILISFPLGGCVDEVADNQTNYQGYKYIYFLMYHTLKVIYFMNAEGVFRRTIFNVNICLNDT